MDDNNVMNEDKVGPIQRYYHEDSMARMERANKRWFVAWIITFILLIGCVAGFLWYEAQWETVEAVTQEVTQESEAGSNHFVGGDYYGASTG